MRISILASLVVGAAVSATVIERRIEKSLESRDVTVIYKNADVVTPKVFIISMVSISTPPPSHPFNSNSSPQKPTSGMRMPTQMDLSVTFLP